MKYVMLGTLGPEWVTRQSERTDKARAKLDELGIELETLYYTQGPFDFIDIVDAPDAEAVLAFSIWYSSQGLGRIVTMPAFSESELAAAVKRA